MYKVPYPFIRGLEIEGRHPHDVGAQVRRTRLLEQLLFDFGGPPKTTASRRGNEHDDADLTGVLVEGSP